MKIEDKSSGGIDVWRQLIRRRMEREMIKDCCLGAFQNQGEAQHTTKSTAINAVLVRPWLHLYFEMYFTWKKRCLAKPVLLVCSDELYIK